MSKYNGLTKKKQEEREEKKKTGAGAVLASVTGKIQSFAAEWAEKHNQLAKSVESIFKMATAELGKVWSNQQGLADSLDHMDLNVLAIAEINKNIYRRLTEHEAKLKKLEELADTPLLSQDLADAWDAEYKEEIKKAFTIVLERRAKEDAARAEAREREKREAAAAEEAKKEAERAEEELRRAESEGLVRDAASGGQGASIPDGAQIFGGA